jgi:hypothetical protein
MQIFGNCSDSSSDSLACPRKEDRSKRSPVHADNLKRFSTLMNAGRYSLGQALRVGRLRVREDKNIVSDVDQQAEEAGPGLTRLGLHRKR